MGFQEDTHINDEEDFMIEKINFVYMDKVDGFKYIFSRFNEEES